MKKIFHFSIIIFLTYTLTACGHSYMGKIIQKDMTSKIQPPGKKSHHFILTHLVLDYTYSVLPDHHSIIMKGTLNERQQDPDVHFVQDTWTLEEAYLDIYFLDANRRAVDVCRHKFPLGHFVFPHPFELTCKYMPEYKYVAPSYTYRYTGYTSKGKAEKIYYHQLVTE